MRQRQVLRSWPTVALDACLAVAGLAYAIVTAVSALRDRDPFLAQWAGADLLVAAVAALMARERLITGDDGLEAVGVLRRRRCRWSEIDMVEVASSMGGGRWCVRVWSGGRSFDTMINRLTIHRGFIGALLRGPRVACPADVRRAASLLDSHLPVRMHRSHKSGDE